ncbi:MAG: PAB-dependent poly(A)-specific ribonuclease subunit 3 [Peltula sp. TS41687]|nr:MAG: PAB-dependent poly(A)-specific ribonuclease subunit 3 [Peltula sp. TS41687]
MAAASNRPSPRSAMSHDPTKPPPSQIQVESARKRLNVDSPSFTPSSSLRPTTNGFGKGINTRTISPKAASAAPFTPKKLNPGTVSPFVLQGSASPQWGPSEIPEFVPQSSFDTLHGPGDANSHNSGLHPFDTYTNTVGTLTDTGAGTHHSQVNPYAPDTTGMGSSSTAFYQGQGGYAQPVGKALSVLNPSFLFRRPMSIWEQVQYHLYAPLGPHRENLLPYQRTVHDFFISDGLREELQRKAEASLQILPNSTLPPQIDHFHSLVPLDTTNQKNAATFGYPSWVYKAMSSKDGKLYALRRLEGYRLTNEKSIRSVQLWKRIDNGNVVTIHDAFTTGAFGDRSLIFVMDYHPLSKTLTEHHFSLGGPRFSGRSTGTPVPEHVLWSYIVQIGSALKSIHNGGLAARLIDPSKILLTSKGRIRLNGCAVLDVVQYDLQASTSTIDLQQDDFSQFGRLILSLATNNPAAVHQIPKAIEYMTRSSYSTELKDCILWLLSPPQAPPNPPKTIEQFLKGIAGQITASFNATLHLDDQLQSELSREVENGRLVRLMAKLNFINERPEFDHDRQWSETGDRYLLKLFRDHVFHQVDAHGNPVIDLWHVLTCLNKLDAGLDERISLVSRDEQNCLVVSYRELKRGVENAFQDLIRAGRRNNQS